MHSLIWAMNFCYLGTSVNLNENSWKHAYFRYLCFVIQNFCCKTVKFFGEILFGHQMLKWKMKIAHYSVIWPKIVFVCQNEIPFSLPTHSHIPARV